MAVLRRRENKDGTHCWYVNFYYKRKRYNRSTKTDNKKFAQQVLKEIEAKITRGEFNLDEPDREKNIQLKDFIDEYIADAKIEKTPGTVLIDQDALREFMNYAGESIVLRDIPESMVRSFRAYLVNRKNQRRKDGKLSPTTINIKMRCLRTAFNWAMAGDRRYVDTNVFAGINQLHEDTQVVRALTFEDVAKLFEFAEKDGERGKGFAKYLKFLLMTGCRRMEALDLQWGEVDFHGGFITFKKTKTDEGRVVPMNTELTLMLQEMYAESGLRKAETRLFPYHGEYVSKLFKTYRKRANLSGHVKLHSLRHTAAMNMRMQGAQTLNIGQVLGHKNTKTTERYAKAFPVLLRPVTELLSVEKMRQMGQELRRQEEEKTKQLPPLDKSIPTD